MTPEQSLPEQPLPERAPTMSPGVRGFIAVIVLALVGMMLYAAHQRNTAQALMQQSTQLNASLADTRGQVEALSTKLNTLVTAQQEAAQQKAAVQQAAVAAQRQRAGRAVVQRRRAEDVRWKQFQAKLDAQGKAIDDTRTDLVNAKSELSSSIAKTHDELVVLQRKGERSYYEFDLDKSKQFQRAGPVSISLRKAHTKDMYADLKLMVDDAQISQKHVNIYQPVQFYAGDSGQPVELVINSITKNHIRGYISEPKYRRGDLAAMQNQAQQGTTPSSEPPPRKRLSFPQP